MVPSRRPRLLPVLATLVALGTGLSSKASPAEQGAPEEVEEGVEEEVAQQGTYEFTVTERLPVTASSTLTIPAEDFELRPLESGAARSPPRGSSAWRKR